MGLNIYEKPDPSTAFSNDQSFSNALSFTADGATGAAISRRYYIRNDDELLFYASITLKPTVTSGIDIISGATTGFKWKLIVGDQQPLEDQWGLVTAGNTINFSSIGSSGNGDIVTYLPFWLRVEIPRAAQVDSFQNIGLEITADESTV